MCSQTSMDCWRPMVRAYVRRCVRCIQTTARTTNQLMGSLPSQRVHLSRPFSKTGLDYAGPFRIKSVKGREIRSSKGYLALFVCLATKAVHMEVVDDLTTASFLGALRRFVGRRGLPAELWSDNATTFNGADVALRSTFRDSMWQMCWQMRVCSGTSSLHQLHISAACGRLPSSRLNHALSALSMSSS